MIYELRFYDPQPGRLPDLLARFRDRLPSLFTRHAIRCIGQWVTDEVDPATGLPAPRFAYMTVFPDLGQREAAWAGFGADPEWHRARTESNGASEMLRGYDLFLLRANGSPTVREDLLSEGGVHQLLLLRTMHGRGTSLSNWLQEIVETTLKQAGATLAGCFDLVAGPDLPQSILWVQWPYAHATCASALLFADSLSTREHLTRVVPSTIGMRRAVDFKSTSKRECKSAHDRSA